MSRKPVKLSAAVLFACAPTALAIALLGGQSAAAASKSVTCPDNTTGVKYAGWTVHCSGQSALQGSVSTTGASKGVLRVKVRFPWIDRFVSANATFDKKTATSQIVLTPQSTGSQAYITITVSAPNGGPPKVVSVNKPVSTAQAAANSCVLSYAE